MFPDFPFAANSMHWVEKGQLTLLFFLAATAHLYRYVEQNFGSPLDS